MRDLPEVSVIMPVYNAGQWLAHAVDGVLNQTFCDFELLLVDDGAKDGSGAFCDEVAARDPRVRVFHRVNSGICASRNFGLSQSRGTYVALCDHDDFCEPCWLQKLVDAAKLSGCPVVKCDHTTERRDPEGRTSPYYRGARWKMKGGVYRPRELISWQDYGRFRFLTSSIWDCLFSRDFLVAHGFSFDEAFRCGGEDLMFMRRVASAAERMFWIDERLYRHYENIGLSTSVKYHPSIPEDFLRIVRVEHEFFPAKDADTAFIQCKCWIRTLHKYAYAIDGCPISLSERARMVMRFHEVLVGDFPCATRLPPGDRFCSFLLGHGWPRSYLLSRSASRAVLRTFRALRKKIRTAGGK